MMNAAIHGKLKGKGKRYSVCPSCGRAIDHNRDPMWLGNGGWWCGDCGKKAREPKQAEEAGKETCDGPNSSDK